MASDGNIHFPTTSRDPAADRVSPASIFGIGSLIDACWEYETVQPRSTATLEEVPVVLTSSSSSASYSNGSSGRLAQQAGLARASRPSQRTGSTVHSGCGVPSDVLDS